MTPADDLPSLVILTLGACSAERGDAAGARFGPGKPSALLAYLACAPRRTAGRDELVGMLWPDLAPEAGRHALRQTAWHIRRRLGDCVMATSGSEIALTCPLESDRDRFCAEVDAGRCQAAVDCYRGEFLAPLSLPGAGEFERWADTERSRLRGLFVRCAEKAAREALAAGRFREGVALARRARDGDPWAQTGHRLVLEALLASSDPLGATAEADSIERFLLAEEIAPEPATRSSIAEARASLRSDAIPGGVRAGIAFVTDLVGREREFARLIEHWSQARAGGFSHVHVTASAGMGKSRLLQDFAARLKAKRSRIAGVQIQSAERHVPFAAAADVAGAMARLPGAAALGESAAATLVAMNPALSSVFTAQPEAAAGGDAVLRRALALAELAHLVADEAPLAILVDDLHWADPESRAVILAMIARLDGARAMAVTAARPSEDPILLWQSVESLALDPLDAQAVADLVSSIATLPDEAWAAVLGKALHGASGGQPLGVVETLQLALDRCVLCIEEGTWRCTDPAQLDALLARGSALDRRIAALDGPDLAIARLLSAAGMPLLTVMLAPGAGLREEDVVAHLQSLEQRGFVRAAGARWAIAHDEIANAVLAAAPDAALREAHRALGTAYASAPGAKPQLAIEHFVRSNDVRPVGDLFVSDLRRARKEGDWRPTAALWRQFAGVAAAAELASVGLPRVPLGLRRRWRVGAIAGAAVVAVAALALGASALRRQTSARAWIELRAPHDSVLVTARAPLSASTFLVSGPLRMNRTFTPLSVSQETDAARGYAHGLRLSSGDLIYHRTVGDSGGIDIFRRTADGAEQRMTNAPGDDVEGDLSPDERFLAFLTQRWDAHEHTDLGVLDVRSGAVRRLTRTDAYEANPMWSPGGGLIAFGRTFFIDRTPEVCVIGPDGTGERCATAPGGAAAEPLGWRGPREVLLSVRNDTARALVALDVVSWSYRPIHEGAAAYVASRNGEFFAAGYGVPDEDGDVWMVGRTDGAGSLRRVAWPEPVAIVTFADGSVPTPHLASARTVAPPAPLRADERARLAVRGVDQRGEPYPVVGVTWTSLDTMVVRVSADGVVSPVAAGAGRVVASVGGWLVDTAAIDVAKPAPSSTSAAASAPANEALAERWEAINSSRWVSFGYPRPFIAAKDGQRVLSLNGDSTFDSGVHSARLFSPADGLAVHAMVSVRLTALQWQTAGVWVMAVAPAELRRWDHLTGGLPPARPAGECAAGLPQGEGMPGGERGGLTGPRMLRGYELTPAQKRGGWVTVDIQVFPDGRCAFAIDGIPRAVTGRAFSPGDSVAVVLGGKAHRTESLVGPVEVWTGIRPGINWGPVLVRR
ncbi:MAG: AAA family ATPase [Gemmatimonadaceae bacterium]|nr:AAA family ATPase [Gemmatimonadaceae bacterium]